MSQPDHIVSPSLEDILGDAAPVPSSAHRFNPNDNFDDLDFMKEDASRSRNASAGAGHSLRNSDGSNQLASGRVPNRSSVSSSATHVQIVVSDPVKQGEGMNSYITYKVTSQRVPENEQFSVVRRFNDFLWLHEQLTVKYKGVIIPPLPEKALIGRFDPEFVDLRRTSLEKFLNRVADHPKLGSSSELTTFLDANDQELGVAKVASSQKRGLSTIGDMFSRVTTSISQRFGSSQRVKSFGDDECESALHYAANLKGHLENVATQGEAVNKKTRDMTSSLFDLGMAMTLLGQCEKESPVGEALVKLGSAADRLSVYFQQTTEKENSEFVEPIRDYIRVTQAVQDMLACRAEVQAVHQAAVADSESKQSKLAALKAKPGTKEDKILAAEMELVESQKRVEETHTQLDEVTHSTLDELQRFQREKLRDFKRIMLDLIRLRIEHAEKMKASWESVLGDVQHLPEN